MFVFVFVCSFPLDVATRRACATLWVADPTETTEALDILLKDLENLVDSKQL